LGHEERFPPPRLNDRYGFSKETVAITTGNEEHAPKADLQIARWSETCLKSVGNKAYEVAGARVYWG
jgi:hypothetical protein